MKKLFIKILSAFFLFFSLCHKANGQVTITGPACVIPATEYQYIVDANWPDSVQIHLCVPGGSILLDTSINCYDGVPLSFVRIKWDDSISNGSINITSLNGNVTFNTTLTTILNGGSIDTLQSVQTLDSASIPSMIICSGATGGNCSPVYAYQWQQSADNINWVDIYGSVFKDLEFSSFLSGTTYYRRKVTETISHSVEYSDVASIFINGQTQSGE